LSGIHTTDPYCRINGTGIGPLGYCAQPLADAPIGGYGAVWGNPPDVPGTCGAGGYDVADIAAG